uniref:Uncharacterized protein n=1 Tax=Echinococcus canadensis TaxID=519352 RepID=A0A915EWG3_9CEST
MYHNLADHRQHTSHVGGTAAYLDGIFYNRYRLKANYHKKEIFLNRMNTYGLHLLQDECVFAMGSVNCLRFSIGKHGMKRLQLISHPSLVQNIKLQKYKSLPSKKHTKFNKYQLWLSSLNNNIKHKSRWLSALMNGFAEAIPRQKGKLWHQIFQSLGTMNIRDNRFKSALKFFTRPSASEKTTTKWVVYAILFVTKVTTLDLSAQKCKRSIEEDLDFDTKIPNITKVYSLLIYVMVTSAGLKALTQRAISNLAAIPTVVASINQLLMGNTTYLCFVSSISLPSRSRTSVTVMNGSLPRHFQNTADINYSRGIFIWTGNSLIVFIFSNHVKNLDANCIKIHTIKFCTTYVNATNFPKNQNDQEHLKGEQTYEYFFNFICWLEIVGAKGLYMKFYVCCLNKA